MTTQVQAQAAAVAVPARSGVNSSGSAKGGVKGGGKGGVNDDVNGSVDSRVKVTVDVGRCVGCLACATVCKPDALRPIPGAWAVAADDDRCTACRRCVSACPFGAITVTGQPRNRHRMVVDGLRAALRSTCPGGWTVTSNGPKFRPAPGLDAVVPDLAVVRTPGPGLEWLSRDEVAVPLVVDVLSPTARQADLMARWELYRLCGVSTYWTVDQRTGGITVQWSHRRDWFDPWARFTFG